MKRALDPPNGTCDHCHGPLDGLPAVRTIDGTYCTYDCYARAERRVPCDECRNWFDPDLIGFDGLCADCELVELARDMSASLTGGARR